MSCAAVAESLEFILDSRKDLINEVRQSEGMEIFKVTRSKIYAYDDYWDRKVMFNFPDQICLKKIVTFNRSKISKDVFFRLLSKLDKELFMTVKKIIFIERSADYKRLCKRFGRDFIDFDHGIGIHLFAESTIIVNIHAIKKCCKEDCFLNAYYQEEVNIGLWTTLIHELRHTYQQNPLFENKFDGFNSEKIEDDAEQYGRSKFESIIEPENYYVI